MDVPSWHPANSNSDALRRLATSGEAAPSRTEFKVVDTSTEEERQQVVKDDDVNVVLGGGRGLLDPSDRLFLLEQTQLEQQANSREQLERDAALQTFRSNALKVHAHKPEIAVTTGKPLRLIPEKKAVVVIRAKKRRRTSEKEAKLKKTKKMPDSTESEVKEEDRKKDAAKAVKSKSPATALLLQDYSSSSEDE